MYDNLQKKISKLINYDLVTMDIGYIVKWKEEDGFLDAVIIEAVKRGVRSKGKDVKISYIDGILKNWKNQNVKSLTDISELDKKYYEKKKEQYKNGGTISLSDDKKDIDFNKSVDEMLNPPFIKKGKKKNFVLDTNILIHNPNSVFKFDDNDIYIVHSVFEELDNFKNEKSERGFSAREAFRILKRLRDKGNLRNGIKLNEEGGTLYSIIAEELDFSLLPIGWDKEKIDNIILLTVIYLSKKLDNVILVTNDCNMQFKADMLGIQVEEYKNDRVKINESVYTGEDTVYVSDNSFNDLIKNGSIEAEFEAKPFLPNTYITLKKYDEGSYLAKYYDGDFHKLNYQEEHPVGLTPKNRTQRFLLESLMNNDIPLTIVNGPAGTGKTLFAIGVGLEKVMERKEYKRVLIARANITMDEDIGFLPGSEQEKINPLLRGIYDNLEVILGNKDDTPSMMEDKIREVFQRGYITAQSIGYLRGRSITDTYMIIDEAQNCTPRQIFSIVTRMGMNSKIVLLGDVNQVDNVRLDSRNNGLVYAINKMKESPYTDIITFDENDCFRSPLAKDASERLKLS